MNNPYFTTVGSYMQPLDPQELAKLNPSFQNIGQQQANQSAAMQQGNQLTQQAGQTGQQSGMSPMAMAMALRGKKPDDAMNMLNNSSSSQDYMNKIGATSSGNPIGGSAGDYANEWWMK